MQDRRRWYSIRGVAAAEVTGKDRINAAKGTVKATVLEDCMPLETCPLVVASVYDTKPVHVCPCFARKSNGSRRRERLGTTPPATTGSAVSCACVSMTRTILAWRDVDISNQLRGSYRPGAKWMRKHKWWHTMYYWAKGTDLVNVYNLPRRRGLSVAAQRGDKQSLGDRGHGKKRNSTSTSKRAAAQLVAGHSSTSTQCKHGAFVTAARVGDPTH